MTESSSAQVIATESTPVSGTGTRNAAEAPLLAPRLRNSIAAGITPQDQSGKGMQNKDALKTPATKKAKKNISR